MNDRDLGDLRCRSPGVVAGLVEPDDTGAACRGAGSGLEKSVFARVENPFPEKTGVRLFADLEKAGDWGENSGHMQRKLRRVAPWKGPQSYKRRNPEYAKKTDEGCLVPTELASLQADLWPKSIRPPAPTGQLG